MLASAGEPAVIPELAAFAVITTTEEVAQVLRLADEVVQRNMRIGRLPGFKAGGTWRARRVDIQAVMTNSWPPTDAAG